MMRADDKSILAYIFFKMHRAFAALSFTLKKKKTDIIQCDTDY